MKIANLLLATCSILSIAAMCSFCKPVVRDASIEPELPIEVTKANAAVVILDPNTSSPRCGGVSVYDHDGTAVLVTAAHCVTRKKNVFDPSPTTERWARVGDEISYVTRNEWYASESGSFGAVIKELDTSRDWSVLSINPYEVPRPLVAVNLSNRILVLGEHVHVIAPVFDWIRHDGEIVHTAFSGMDSYFVEMSTSIEFGYSGSPVIMDSGEVLGIVIQCSVPDDVRKCVPGWSIATTVP